MSALDVGMALLRKAALILTGAKSLSGAASLGEAIAGLLRGVADRVERIWPPPVEPMTSSPGPDITSFERDGRVFPAANRPPAHWLERIRRADPRLVELLATQPTSLTTPAPGVSPDTWVANTQAKNTPTALAVAETPCDHSPSSSRAGPATTVSPAVACDPNTQVKDTLTTLAVSETPSNHPPLLRVACAAKERAEQADARLKTSATARAWAGSLKKPRRVDPLQADACEPMPSGVEDLSAKGLDAPSFQSVDEDPPIEFTRPSVQAPDTCRATVLHREDPAQTPGIPAVENGPGDHAETESFAFPGSVPGSLEHRPGLNAQGASVASTDGIDFIGAGVDGLVRRERTAPTPLPEHKPDTELERHDLNVSLESEQPGSSEAGRDAKKVLGRDVLSSKSHELAEGRSFEHGVLRDRGLDSRMQTRAMISRTLAQRDRWPRLPEVDERPGPIEVESLMQSRPKTPGALAQRDLWPKLPEVDERPGPVGSESLLRRTRRQTRLNEEQRGGS